jgi:hypothetical protein
LQPSAYSLSESGHLVVHFDLPCAVVGNDKHGTCVMAHGSIELCCIEAEGTVSGSNNDGPIRIGEARRNSVRHADPKTTEWSGIQNRWCRKSNPGKAEEITTVDDKDCIRRQLILYRSEQTIWMHPAV